VPLHEEIKETQAMLEKEKENNDDLFEKE